MSEKRPCAAAVCKRHCPDYVPGGKSGGWELCECGHTKQVHLQKKGKIKS